MNSTNRRFNWRICRWEFHKQGKTELSREFNNARSNTLYATSSTLIYKWFKVIGVDRLQRIKFINLRRYTVGILISQKMMVLVATWSCSSDVSIRLLSQSNMSNLISSQSFSDMTNSNAKIRDHKAQRKKQKANAIENENWNGCMFKIKAKKRYCNIPRYY